MPEARPAGDSATLLVVGDQMSYEVMAKSHCLAQAVRSCNLLGMRGVVVGRSSLMVHYDPALVSHQQIVSIIRDLVEKGLYAELPEGTMKELPTVYGGAYGPDLPYVAQYHGLSEEEVVRIQSSAIYTVCSLGFAPGQPLLMGLPSRLVMPRRESPRGRVEAGSVLVANQTSLYSLPNPTGWWLIGRTSVRLFDPRSPSLIYLQAGDQVRFIPVSEEEYLSLGEPSI